MAGWWDDDDSVVRSVVGGAGSLIRHKLVEVGVGGIELRFEDLIRRAQPISTTCFAHSKYSRRR